MISNGFEKLPLTSFGTGVQQLLLILSMIYETNSKIVLIEELELNLSPRSQQLLLLILANLIKDKKLDQVILTSHSDVLASTADINTYEISISEGVSEVKKIEAKKGVLQTQFFKRDSRLDAELKKSYIPQPPGKEWD